MTQVMNEPSPRRLKAGTSLMRLGSRNREDVHREHKKFPASLGLCFGTELRNNIRPRKPHQCHIFPQRVWCRKSAESAADWQRHWFTISTWERYLERHGFP